MKRIKMYAFLGKNLGDDLMVHILLNRYPQYKFFCDSSGPNSDMFLKYPNYENRTPLLRKYGRLNHLLNVLTGYRKEDFFFHSLFRRRAKNCICGVLIGGSMFMQLDAEPSRQAGWEETRFGSLPRFVIGVNFGPYQTEDFKTAFDGYFLRCRGVTFRDMTSYRLFEANGNAAYAPDVVLNLPVDAYRNKSSDNTVLISVIDICRRPKLVEWTMDYERFIMDCCVASIQRGKTPVLMSFCRQEGDDDGIRRILNGLAPEIREKTKVFSYTGNLDEALEVFAGADYVVATRFHAMILALRFHKPFFSVAYSDKVKWVLDDLRCAAYCGLEKLAALDAGTMFDTYSEPVEAESYIRQAAHQFDQFDRYMEDEHK